MTAVLVAVILLASSCGGDAAAARGDVSQGDAQLVKLKTVSEQLQKQISALFSGAFAGGKVDATAFKTNADTVKETADKLATGAASARKEYAKVDALEQVPAYKQYADDQIKVIDLNTAQIDSLKTFLDKWSAEVSSAEFDPVAFVGAARDLSTQMDTTAAAIKKLEDQASALKKKEKL